MFLICIRCNGTFVEKSIKEIFESLSSKELGLLLLKDKRALKITMGLVELLSELESRSADIRNSSRRHSAL